MITSKFLRDIEAEARPIIERQMNDAKIIAGLRDVVAAAGGDWGALKALIKARVEDDNDEAGEGKRVRKIREKADCIVAYDDMLGSNMNEKNFSASQSYAEAKGRDPAAPGASNSKASNAEGRETPATLTDTQEQPETANEIHERPSINAEAYPEAGPQAEASPAGIGTGTLAGHEGRSEGEAASVDLPTNSNPQPNLLPGAGKAGDVPPPSSPAALSDADVPAFLKPEQRKNIADYRPNCIHPDACAATGLTHCYVCRKAMEAASETEAAA